MWQVTFQRQDFWCQATGRPVDLIVVRTLWCWRTSAMGFPWGRPNPFLTSTGPRSTFLKTGRIWGIRPPCRKWLVREPADASAVEDIFYRNQYVLMLKLPHFSCHWLRAMICSTKIPAVSWRKACSFVHRVSALWGTAKLGHLNHSIDFEWFYYARSIFSRGQEIQRIELHDMLSYTAHLCTFV